jgi:16S rRNA pseudouridine516 synthase
MELQEILYSQGFGTRRVCAGLVQQGWVGVQAPGDTTVRMCRDAAQQFDPEGLMFEVQGQRWPYQSRAYILLNKPAGVECSQKPSLYPSVYSLLPAPLRQRPQKSAIQGVQAVGRLDQDTTGLLLLSDDGQFIHRMSSPKKHVPKVYVATVKHPLTLVQIDKLLSGVVLDDDPRPVKASAARIMSEFVLELVLTEGKYHQVKRMVAAVSNRVEALHRSQIGQLKLPEDLAPGQWRWLFENDLNQINA